MILNSAQRVHQAARCLQHEKFIVCPCLVAAMLSSCDGRLYEHMLNTQEQV